MIFLSDCLPWNLYTRQHSIKKRDPLGHWKNGWIQTPQRILMDPCIKQAPVLSKRFWSIPWPLAYHRLDCNRKISNFWYTFGWKWWVISFRDYLGLSNACSYDIDDVIGRADRFGFQNFCCPDTDQCLPLRNTAEIWDFKSTTMQCIFKIGVQTLEVFLVWWRSL